MQNIKSYIQLLLFNVLIIKNLSLLVLLILLILLIDMPYYIITK